MKLESMEQEFSEIPQLLNSMIIQRDRDRNDFYDRTKEECIRYLEQRKKLKKLGIRLGIPVMLILLWITVGMIINFQRSRVTLEGVTYHNAEAKEFIDGLEEIFTQTRSEIESAYGNPIRDRKGFFIYKSRIFENASLCIEYDATSNRPEIITWNYEVLDEEGKVPSDSVEKYHSLGYVIRKACTEKWGSPQISNYQWEWRNVSDILSSVELLGTDYSVAIFLRANN